MPGKVPTHKVRSALASRVKSTRYRDDPTVRFYSRRSWRGSDHKLGTRDLKLRQDPLCEDCKARGRLVVATEVHHKVEVRIDADASLDIDNLESLCSPCHSRITASRMHAT